MTDFIKGLRDGWRAAVVTKQMILATGIASSVVTAIALIAFKLA